MHVRAIKREKSSQKLHDRNLGQRSSSHRNVSFSSQKSPQRKSIVHDPEIQRNAVARNAALNNNVVALEYFVGNNGNVNLVDGKYGWTLLHVACKSDAVDAVKYLVETAGASLHVINAEGNTPFDDAIEHRSDDTVQYLVESGKLPYTVETAGLAARSGYLDIVKKFVEIQGHKSQGGMHYKKKWFLAILEQACKGNNADIVKYLLEFATKTHKPNELLNAKNADGDTILHTASRLENINLDIIDMLLKRDEINVAILNKRGHSPLISACKAKRERIVRRLLESEKVLHSTNTICAILASKLQRWEVVQAYVRNGGDVNGTITSFPKLTLLHLAAQHGSLSTIKLLVEAGAKANKKDSKGNTPLLLMIKQRHVECAMWFINYANPTIDNNSIIHATINGWTFVLEEKLKTDPSAPSKFKNIYHHGLSLMQIACENKQELLATFLVKITEGDFTQRDQSGLTGVECIFEHGILNAIPHVVRKRFHIRDLEGDMWGESTERTGKQLLLTYQRELSAQQRNIALERANFLPWVVFADRATIPLHDDVAGSLVKGSLIRDGKRILYVANEMWNCRDEVDDSAFQKRKEFHYSTIMKFVEGYDGPDFDYIWLGLSCLDPNLKDQEPELHNTQLHNILTAVALASIVLYVPDTFVGTNSAGKRYQGSSMRPFTESAWVELENTCALLCGISQYIAICSEEDVHFSLLTCMAHQFEEASRSAMRAFNRTQEDMLIMHTYLGSRFRDPVNTIEAVSKFFNECEKTVLMKVLIENQFTEFETDNAQVQSLKRYFKGRVIEPDDITIIMSSLMGILGFCLDVTIDHLEQKVKKEKPISGRVWLKHNSSRLLLKRSVTPVKIKKKGIRSFFKKDKSSEWQLEDLDRFIEEYGSPRTDEPANHF